jgi:Hypothetical protein (DUF2513)
MRRDMDLIRDLLMFIEKDEQLNGVAYGPVTEDAARELDRSPEFVRYHMKLLVDAKYVDLVHFMADGEPWIRGLTWDDCEFLETIRDPEIWKSTKSGLQALGSFSVGVLREIATALIRAKMQSLGIAP